MVPMRVNAEKEGKELAERFAVTGLPTLVFADSSGAEVERITGYLPPDKFLAEVRRIRSGDTFAACLKVLGTSPDDSVALKRAVNGLLERSDPEGALARIRAFHEATDGAQLALCKELLFDARSVLHERLYARAGKLFRQGWSELLEVPGDEAAGRLKLLLEDGLTELEGEEQALRLRQARQADGADLLAEIDRDRLVPDQMLELAGFAARNGLCDESAELYVRWFEDTGRELEVGPFNEVAWNLYLCKRSLPTAVEIARKAVAADDTPNVVDTLARLLYVSGSTQEAIALEARAAEEVEGKRAAEEFASAVEKMRAGEPLGDLSDIESYPG